MSANEEKAAWFKSMHLRPVYTLDEGEEPRAYIAVSTLSDKYIMLFAVEGYGGRKVTFNQRGSVFPYSDVEIAADTIFGTQVAKKRNEMKEHYCREEEDDE